MKVKTETIIRTVVLALALVNQILASTGHSVIPISDEQVETAITLAITICASIWTWWKNNSFTKNALIADKALDDLKAQNK